MYKIKKNSKHINTLLNLSRKNFVFHSIIEGHTCGDIYINSLEKPELYVVFDGGNFVLYIGGESTDDSLYEKCIKYINEHILTNELREKYDDHIMVSYSSDRLKKEFSNVFQDKIVHNGLRTLYRFDVDNYKYENFEHSLCDIRLIDEAVISSNLENIGLLINEIKCMWGSNDLFLRNGFGYSAVKNNKLISWCTAEFVSMNHCGIGIETVSDEQHQGIGTAVAATFVSECVRKKIIPYWDSWLKNVSSVKIAEKVGFEKIEDYEVFVVQF